MRILFNNLIDGLAASRISALTEEALYEASRVQDQRLTTQWQTTSPTAQTIIFSGSCDTIVGGNIGLVTGSAATNLITDPENMASANWTKTNAVVTTVESIIGYPAYRVLSVAGTWAWNASSYFYPAASQLSVLVVARKDSTDNAQVNVYNASTGSNVVNVAVAFASKTITYTTGSAAIPPQWIDDSTVRIYAKAASVSAGNAIQIHLLADKNQGTAQSTIYSAPMVINNAHPVPYVATSRSAITTTYAFRLPPSGKFIIDCEFVPYFSYDTAISPGVLGGWFIDALSSLYILYEIASDNFRIRYEDSGNAKFLETGAFTSSAQFNTRQRLTASLDISGGDIAGSQLFLNGTLVDSAWTGVPDVLAATGYTTLSIGQILSGSRMDTLFRKFHIYGGVFTSAQSGITTEAEIDAALANHTLLFDQTYQRRFDMDTVAILGHNISEGAAITMQANDFNEWNYVDGSGSSIIQHALTWDDETILKMITATKKQYVKFTINDPNNDDGKIKIGRFWIGRYLDIDPASLDNFTVTKKRTDDVTMGVNMQKFAAIGTGYREFDLRFPPTLSTMVTAIQTMYNHVGNHSSVIFCNFDTLRSWELVEPVYCSIVGDVSFKHNGRQKYDYGLRLQENK